MVVPLQILSSRLSPTKGTRLSESDLMPYYIQRRDCTNVVKTIDEYEDAKEAYMAAREYNLRDPDARHYVAKKPCKTWANEKQTANLT